MTISFTSYVPTPAAAYCQHLWQQYAFSFRVAKPRRSRLGDFRVLPNGQMQITVNADLNPFAFLITYIHEVAHADVHGRYRRPGLPHGKNWQKAFQRLMQPMLTDAIFPPVILEPLLAYMASPAATTYANSALMLALRSVDKQRISVEKPNQMLLKDIPDGHSFRLGKKEFVRGELRRTRIVCKEIASGKSFAILAHAWVETV